MESSKKAQKSTRPRLRTDTYWNFSDEENAAYFGAIEQGESDLYYLDSPVTKLNHKGKPKYCWRVFSRATNAPVDSLRSAKSYRLSLMWSIHCKPSFWKHPAKLEKLKATLPKILTKFGEHSRHLCGHNWCCNPRHIVVGSRTQNEIDKHFHYFLNHQDQSVRRKFLEAFPDLIKSQGVW